MVLSSLINRKLALLFPRNIIPIVLFLTPAASRVTAAKKSCHFWSEPNQATTQKGHLLAGVLKLSMEAYDMQEHRTLRICGCDWPEPLAALMLCNTRVPIEPLNARVGRSMPWGGLLGWIYICLGGWVVVKKHRIARGWRWDGVDDVNRTSRRLEVTVRMICCWWCPSKFCDELFSKPS